MGIFDIFKVKSYKQEIERLKNEVQAFALTKEELKYRDLKKELETLENDAKLKVDLINSLNISISEKQSKVDSLDKIIKDNSEIHDKITLLSDLNKKVTDRKIELGELDELESYQSFGLYRPKYNLMDSSAYKDELDKVRQLQKQMVKDKSAVNYYDGWTLDGSKAKGTAMNNDNIKLVLRSFNNECDASIIKIKFNNVQSVENKIKKSFELLNKISVRNKISLTQKYLNLKLKELHLAYEYEVKKQEEKEEQMRIKEEMREQAKALKELENKRKVVEKEKTHFQNAIKEIEEQLSNSDGSNKEILLNKLVELNEELNEVKKIEEDIENREKNTRAGYVYIISNLGSFGKDVYKIGMTRRLEPTDRVKELGGASVPFQFDVHAMIFSNDAPGLENALHKKFAHRSVNKINMRKEFFNVSLAEIEAEVKANFTEVVEFTKIAEASEYRQTLELEKETVKTA